jgi:hypothetical protein
MILFFGVKFEACAFFDLSDQLWLFIKPIIMSHILPSVDHIFLSDFVRFVISFHLFGFRENPRKQETFQACFFLSETKQVYIRGIWKRKRKKRFLWYCGACFSLTEAKAVTRETETVNGHRLGPATRPSIPKAMASHPNNAVKGFILFLSLNQ